MTQESRYSRSKSIMFIQALIVALSVVLSVGCRVSLDCGDTDGRSICYEHHCRRDVPCNKDNDCFFYGAADVSQGYPQLRCYINERVISAPGYGVCMDSARADGLKRLPGDDVVDVTPKTNIDEEPDFKRIFNFGKDV